MDKIFGKNCENVSKYGLFSGLYFPAFGLNMERYEVSLCVQSECRKMQTRKNSVFGHFSHSEKVKKTSKIVQAQKTLITASA